MISSELANILEYEPLKNVPMNEYTSFRVGGKVDYLFRPVNTEELKLILKQLKANQLPFFILGRGTNLLIKDGGFRGAAILMSEGFNHIEQKGKYILAGAGISLPALSKAAAEGGLSGLEFASGIPGSLGGALIMNAGAYGACLANLVNEVKIIDYEGEEIKLAKEHINFGYRYSSLKNEKGIIVESLLALQEDDPECIKERMESYLNQRKRKHPCLPSAGSVFQNEPEVPAGKLIEEAGGKGLKVGRAMVSYEHANFIVNTGGATAAQIIELIHKVKQKVWQYHGIELKMEVEILGEE